MEFCRRTCTWETGIRGFFAREGPGRQQGLDGQNSRGKKAQGRLSRVGTLERRVFTAEHGQCIWRTPVKGRAEVPEVGSEDAWSLPSQVFPTSLDSLEPALAARAPSVTAGTEYSGMEYYHSTPYIVP